MLLAGCSKRNPLPLIPEPQSAGATGGSFELSPNCEILADGRLTNEAALLASRLRVSTGYPLNISTNLAGASDGGDIVLALDSEVSGGPEAYALYVSAEGARIHGASSAGVFYGIQTLLQLMPPAACGNRLLAKRAWEIPEAEIVDEPRFKWRGLMLDVSRHFFTKQEVEKLLDTMAFYKLNVFHWHLVDDQGWRLEIKRYPRLTEIGAWRKGVGFGLDAKSTTAYGPDGRYGGFYTQQDAREIVAYAAARHITIVPEIEMPGHSSAALAAYPELSCSGGPFSTDLPAGIFNGVYCVGKEETFTFLKNVLTEVFDLFPGPYIHLGGDEVLTNSWHDCAACQALKQKLGLQNDLQLQGYFMRRMA
ncbi:MAG TPA: beta-N-acetylhexosaminidase, partial [Verrucomicrobiae bacterium]|nr:beta-N-acetylhexosaminidase [Verrucomicrobiae bacterium]